MEITIYLRRQPTSKSPQQVLSDFSNISTGTTYGAIVNFLDSDFSGEGLELESISLSNFNGDPPFLQNVTDPLLQAWSQTVHGYWTQLIRGSNTSQRCGASDPCQSSFIPLNHTFVVPGDVEPFRPYALLQLLCRWSLQGTILLG